MIPEYAKKYAEWVKAHPEARDFGEFKRRSEMHYAQVVRIGYQPITYLEFGVRSGKSLRWWQEGNTHPESWFVGFDSFEGLPEEWTTASQVYEKGSLTKNGKVPEFKDERVEIVKGWFSDTVPTFFDWFERDRTLVVHVDCDLYGSTKTIFEHLTMQTGDTLIMDEAGTGDEFKAFVESGIEAVPIAHAGSAVVAEVL